MSYTKGEVFVKKESTWGVGADPSVPTNNIDEILGLDSGYEYGLENQVTAVNPAALEHPSEISYHTAKPRGKIDFVYNGALPFALMLGGIENSDPLEEDGPYTWTITPSQNPIPFTTSCLMKGTNDRKAQIVGCLAKSLSFKMGLNDPVSGTMEIIGRDLNLGNPFTSPTTLANGSAPSWKPHEFTYAIGQITGINYITELEFTLSRTVEVGHSLASRLPSTSYPGKFEAVSGTITTYIPDKETASEIEELVLGGTGIGETLSAKDIVIDRGYEDGETDSVKMTLSGCIFGDYSAIFPLDTKLSYKFSFSATMVSEVLWEAPFAATNW